MPIRFQVDPDFYDHPKTTGMSDAAFSLWVRAGSYSAAKLTDGFIAEDVLATVLRSSEDVAEELVRRGLWKRSRGGYRFHQWGHRNLEKSRVEADREADRKRKERQRKKRKPQVDTDNVTVDVREDSGGRPADVTPASVSVSVSESVSSPVTPPGHSHLTVLGDGRDTGDSSDTISAAVELAAQRYAEHQVAKNGGRSADGLARWWLQENEVGARQRAQRLVADYELTTTQLADALSQPVTPSWLRHHRRHVEAS